MHGPEPPHQRCATKSYVHVSVKKLHELSRLSGGMLWTSLKWLSHETRDKLLHRTLRAWLPSRLTSSSRRRPDSILADRSRYCRAWPQ